MLPSRRSRTRGGFGFVDPGGGERGEDGERAGGGDGGSRVDDGEEGDARRRREEAPRRADGHAQRLRPHRARAPVILLEVVLARESVALVRSRDGHEDAVRGGLARGVARDAEDAGGVELRHRPHAREELQRQGVRRGAEDHVRDATAAADGAEVGHRGVRGLERGHGELHREEPVDGLGVILQAELAVEQMLNRRQRERLRGGQEEEHRVQPEVPAERVDERGGGGGVAIGPGGGRERGRRAPRGAEDRGGAVIVVVVVRRLSDHSEASSPGTSTRHRATRDRHAVTTRRARDPRGSADATRAREWRTTKEGTDPRGVCTFIPAVPPRRPGEQSRF